MEGPPRATVGPHSQRPSLLPLRRPCRTSSACSCSCSPSFRVSTKVGEPYHPLRMGMDQAGEKLGDISGATAKVLAGLA